MTEPPLIEMIVVGLGLAFLFGTLANYLRISPIAGYLLAGVAVGPFTPGFVADAGLALQLAQIGVILLMFGVGLHFSLKDLISLRTVLLPGVAAQIALSAALGAVAGHLLGWNWSASTLFGLALSVASSVVLLRALHDQRLMDTARGRLVVGWLVVQDFFMVIALVLIPAIDALLFSPADSSVFSAGGLFGALAITIGKLAAFVAFMLLVGRRLIPAMLHYVAHTGSRELFRLAVLAVALGVAFIAARLFGVSFALGAFFAGMILSESPLSARAAEESLPLRDAFAVLFFVSVGMLFNPGVLLKDVGGLSLAVAVVVIGNAGIGFGLARLMRYGVSTALLLAGGLSQIGEFSFILSDLGVNLRLLDADVRDVILGASIITILLNPAVFTLASRLRPHIAPASTAPDAPNPVEEKIAELKQTELKNHVVLMGYGRVGSLVGAHLKARGEAFVVTEDSDHLVAQLTQEGIEVISGNAVRPEVLAAANVKEARLLFIAIPNGFEAGQIVQQARGLNEKIEIIARAHSNDEVDYLKRLSADVVIMGEREIARGMIEHAFGAAV
ncbi:MAG TPA: cation:proton antiporter [Micropepsaceae bacterium]|nr:cation:proton antiporter [Micropepsaceae bacterium]